MGCIILGLIIVWGLSGGNDLSRFEKGIIFHREPFYIGNGYPHNSRIPLIYPYELIKNPDDYACKIGFKNEHITGNPPYYISGLGNIGKLSVKNRIITLFAYSYDPDLKNMHWVVIIPDQKMRLPLQKKKNSLNI